MFLLLVVSQPVINSKVYFFSSNRLWMSSFDARLPPVDPDSSSATTMKLSSMLKALLVLRSRSFYISDFENTLERAPLLTWELRQAVTMVNPGTTVWF
jgi:hypothetical protein